MNPRWLNGSKIGSLSLLLLTSIVVTQFLPSTPASAICVAPEITLTPESGSPGDEIVVSGVRFFVGCNDTVTLTPGQSPSPPAPEPPDKGIKIEFVQGNRVWLLSTVDAKADDTFEVTVSVPAEAARGAATVRATGSKQPAGKGFDVTRAEPAPVPPVLTELPRTGGFTPVGWLLAGVFTLLLGLWMARRRGMSRLTDGGVA